jgi:hypothetical protein
MRKLQKRDYAVALVALSLSFVLAAVAQSLSATEPTYRAQQLTFGDITRVRAEPAPISWAAPTTWKFSISGDHDQPLGHIILEFTNEPAKTCGSGDFRRAYIRSDATTGLPPSVRYSGPNLAPAYLINGRYLIIELNAPTCDYSVVLRGQLTETSAHGIFAENRFGHDSAFAEFTASHLN